MTRAPRLWLKFLIAILAGNFVYFSLEPHLPPAAQHHAYRPDLGTLVDLWFCLVVYGLIELLILFFRRKRQ
jgi:hypothetical protein